MSDVIDSPIGDYTSLNYKAYTSKVYMKSKALGDFTSAMNRVDNHSNYLASNKLIGAKIPKKHYTPKAIFEANLAKGYPTISAKNEAIS